MIVKLIGSNTISDSSEQNTVYTKIGMNPDTEESQHQVQIGGSIRFFSKTFSNRI
jgi:hypothetical protein